MHKELLIASVLLFGNITNELGRIGIEDHEGFFDNYKHISHVYKGSPADKAGLKEGDVIIAKDDNIVGPVGTTVTLTVKRDHKVFQVTVVRVPFKDINLKS
jgi:C-terminal processing protease CtpA/Prc